jgi:Ca-activated chloride channel family protein
MVAMVLAACVVRPMRVPAAPPPASYPFYDAAATGVVAGARAQVPPRPIGDRDLGKGGDGEKLGEIAIKEREQADDEAWRNAPMDPTTGERYPAPIHNPFMAVAVPGGDASTFGLEVDTASYANVRRWLKDGRLPPPGAARTEDFLNTLTYTYPAPAARDDAPFRASVAVAACPWALEHRLVRVGLKGRELDRDSRPPLNLVYLIDVSGPMNDARKLPLVIDSLEKLAKTLDRRDRLAIATYAGSSRLVLPATPGDQQATIREALRGLRAGGSTNGAGGIVAAYAEAAKGHRAGVQSRVVICTDGDFNVGTTSQGELKTLITEQRKTGVYLSVYGFGMGNLKDETLEMLARAGNGTYGYIDDAPEADRLFIRGALGQMVTIATDAKAQVFFNPAKVAGWRLLGYENRVLRREDFNDDRIDAGEIGAGHTVTALYEVVPAGRPVPGQGPGADTNPFAATATTTVANDALLQLRLRWKPATGEASRLAEVPVPDRLADLDPDFATAAAAAGFSMRLRGTPNTDGLTWDLIERLARQGATQDPEGQRRELLQLIAAAKGLAR